MTDANAKLDSSQLAMTRTWLAHERTLMAWVRTATSMISFGFTIYKFFQFEAGRTASVNKGFLTPRDFAVIMVSIGLLSLLLAAIRHHTDMRELQSQLHQAPRSMAELVAGLVSLFGIVVLISALFRR